EVEPRAPSPRRGEGWGEGAPRSSTITEARHLFETEARPCRRQPVPWTLAGTPIRRASLDPRLPMASTKPNILLLTTNLGLGGSQRVIRDHAAALSHHFQVEKAVFNRDGGDFYGEDEEFLSLEVPGGGGWLHKIVH